MFQRNVQLIGISISSLEFRVLYYFMQFWKEILHVDMLVQKYCILH